MRIEHRHPVEHTFYNTTLIPQGAGRYGATALVHVLRAKHHNMTKTNLVLEGLVVA